jgi:hypothetical protein
MKRLALLGFFVSLPAFAQDNPAPQLTPQQKEEADRHLKNAIGLIDQLKVDTEQVVVEKKVDCMNSIGNLQFCTCIANESPPFVSFQGYISATSLTKKDLRYSSLSLHDQKMVDYSRDARIKCVGLITFN